MTKNLWMKALAKKMINIANKLRLTHIMKTIFSRKTFFTQIVEVSTLWQTPIA